MVGYSGVMMVVTGVAMAEDFQDKAGKTAAIYSNQRYALYRDRVVEGKAMARAISATEMESDYDAEAHAGAAEVGGPVVAEPISAGPVRKWRSGGAAPDVYPRLTSDFPIVDALYNLSLEELALDKRGDGALIAGAKWQGVWTRDVSYSIVLALAAIDPRAARLSLEHKVKRGRIVQDTGTGGSWPVSSDRVAWALAAWEVYLVTGDQGWLEESYGVIRRSMLDDVAVVIDPETGLARGESTFLDWREQTYPRWMQPADIYESYEIGTNAVFYRAFRILEAMRKELGPVAAKAGPGSADERWGERADRMKAAINERFWQQDRGYYGQYLYGRRAKTLSPRSQALGEALAILFDLPSEAQQDRILESQPWTVYGVPTVFPQTPGIPPYHNRSVWPFVQAYANLAAAKRGEEAALVAGLAGIYRAAALYLTNKENFVLDTGSPVGTEINSDRQLWSVAGNLAMTYRVLFGMHFETEGLRLAPVVPEAFGGVRKLTGFRYRGATLSIEVSGFGRKIRNLTMDGRPVEALVPATLTGEHSMVIAMADEALPRGGVRMVANEAAPDTPSVELRSGEGGQGGRLVWEVVPRAVGYRVYRNGQVVHSGRETFAEVLAEETPAEWQVSAVADGDLESFLSEPVISGGKPWEVRVAGGASHFGNSELSVQLARPIKGEEQVGFQSGLEMEVRAPGAGRYEVRFRYANGSGPISTENMCAIRTLFVDEKRVGAVVMPQRGTNEWGKWGLSSGQVVELAEGAHKFELRFEAADENMNPDVNRALVSAVELVRIRAAGAE